MERVAHAYGIEEYNVYVLSNAIFANAVENGRRVETKLKFIPGSSIHFGRIAGINQLSREIEGGSVSIPEACERLHAIVDIPYNPSGGAGAGLRRRQSACFSYLFGGSVFDALAALLCGFVLQIFLNVIDRGTALKFITNLAASALVAFCAVALFSLGPRRQPRQNHHRLDHPPRPRRRADHLDPRLSQRRLPERHDPHDRRLSDRRLHRDRASAPSSCSISILREVLRSYDACRSLRLGGADARRLRRDHRLFDHLPHAAKPVRLCRHHRRGRLADLHRLHALSAGHRFRFVFSPRSAWRTSRASSPLCAARR